MNTDVVIRLSTKTTRMGRRQYNSRETFLLLSPLDTRHNPPATKAAHKSLTPPTTHTQAVCEDNGKNLTATAFKYSKLKPAITVNVSKRVETVGLGAQKSLPTSAT